MKRLGLIRELGGFLNTKSGKIGTTAQNLDNILDLRHKSPDSMVIFYGHWDITDKGRVFR